MKKILLVFLLCFASAAGYSQMSDTEDVYSSDVIQPKFKGGDLDKFYDFFYKEFDFSKAKQKGKMLLAFTINEQGELKNIKILKVLDDDSAIEAIRVLKLSPKWECAKRGGKPYSVEIKLPVGFK